MIRNHEDGIIVKKHSLLRYDVQIPGRAWPWEWVGTLGPQNFEIGEVVKIGFVARNRQIPVILTQKEWPTSGVGPGGEPLRETAGWSTYLQSPERLALAPFADVWTNEEDYLINDSYAGVGRTRTWGDSVYTLKSTNWTSPNYRHTLVETQALTASAPVIRSYYASTGIVEMLVTDEAIYIVEWLSGARVLASARSSHGWNAGQFLSSSRVRKLNRADFSVMWTSTASTARAIRPAPSLSIVDGKLLCLCETATVVGGWNRPRLACLTLDPETGAQLALAPLSFEDPEFLMVSNQQTTSWLTEPTSYGTQPIDVFPEEEHRRDSSWGPFLGTNTVPPIWSNDHASDGTLYWSESMTPAMHDVARFHDWFVLRVWDANEQKVVDRHLPSPRRGQQLACFDANNVVKWRRLGWARGGVREVYTVLCAHTDGRLFVLVEEFTFQDHSCSDAAVVMTDEPLDGNTNGWYSVPIGSGGATSTRHWRFHKSHKIFFEVISAFDGSVLSREQISKQKTREVTLPSGAPGLTPTFETVFTSVVTGPDYEAPPLPPASYPDFHAIDPLGSGGVFRWTNPPYSPVVTVTGLTSGLSNSGVTIGPNGTADYSRVKSGLKPCSIYTGDPEVDYEVSTIYARRGMQLVWPTATYAIEFPEPLAFDPYNCVVTRDGRKVVFAPFWRPFWGSWESDNEIQLYGLELRRKTSPGGGTFDVTEYKSGLKLNQEITMAAFTWKAKPAWKYPFAMGGGTRHFTQGHLLSGANNQILWHYRRSMSASAHTSPGPGNVGVFQRINGASGQLISERVVTNLAPSPAVAGDVYGEVDQHRSALNGQRHPTEVLYAAPDGAVITKMGSRQVFIK